MDTVTEIQHSDQDDKGRFVAGNKLSKGRPKGSRQALSIAFCADLEKAWQEQGISVINRVIAERPQDFLKIVANLMPKDINMRVQHLEDLTDDQLLRKLNALTEMARPLLAKVIEHEPVPISPTKAETP